MSSVSCASGRRSSSGALRQEAQRLGAARQAQQHHADVLDHGEQHLAQHFGLRAAHLLVGLCEAARDDLRSLFSFQTPLTSAVTPGPKRSDELVLPLLDVFGHREQDGRRARLGIEPQPGEEFRDAVRRDRAPTRR